MRPLISFLKWIALSLDKRFPEKLRAEDVAHDLQLMDARMTRIEQEMGKLKILSGVEDMYQTK